MKDFGVGAGLRSGAVRRCLAQKADLARAVGAEIGPVEKRGGNADHEARSGGPEEGGPAIVAEGEACDDDGSGDGRGPEGEEPEAEMREHGRSPYMGGSREQPGKGGEGSRHAVSGRCSWRDA